MKLRIEYVETEPDGLQHFRFKIIDCLPDEAAYILKTGDTKPDVPPEKVVRVTIEGFSDVPIRVRGRR